MVNLKQFQPTLRQQLLFWLRRMKAGRTLTAWAPRGGMSHPKAWEAGGVACPSISTATERIGEHMVCRHCASCANLGSEINVSPRAFSHIIFQISFLAYVLISANGVTSLVHGVWKPWCYSYFSHLSPLLFHVVVSHL